MPGVGCLGHCADIVAAAVTMIIAAAKTARRIRFLRCRLRRIILNKGALMNRRCFVAVAGFAWLAGATAVRAHHSFAAEYDRDRTITVTGVVQKLEWTNPHARIYVEGKDETGKFQLWDFELGPPNGLMRNGWNRNSLRQGHQVVVEGFRSKTSDKVANARTVKLPDGRQVFAGSSFDPGEVK
jgi:hypothetical protein